MSESDDVKHILTEKDKSRKRARAKMMLRLQNHLVEKTYKKNQPLFSEGEEGTELFIVEEGFVDVSVQGRKVFNAHAGDVTGEHSLVLGRPRNTTATCASNECIAVTMPARDFYGFLDSTPHVMDSIREICLRREFMKALVFRTRKPFPTDPEGMKWAFQQVDTERKGKISLNDVRSMLKEMDPTLEENDLKDIFNALDSSKKGFVTLEAFQKMFESNEAQNMVD